jgi:N-acetylglucosamine-6-phosphate deacetylase
MVTLIKNGRIVSSLGVKACDLWIENGRICEEKQNADKTVDVLGAYLLPGFIDIHTHGSSGVNYSKAENFSAALEFCAGQGVTTVVPTIGVRPLDELIASIKNAVSEKNKLKSGARIAGIHLEGPFVNEKKKGAMATPDIPCTKENFLKLTDAAEGNIRVMTIAPERENAYEVISEGASLGIRMSVGHTDADFQTVKLGIDAGISGATHTFNAMRQYDHREPGVLGAVLTDSRVSCEVICDLVHLHFSTIELIKLCKGVGNMILVSDSGMITGLGDGEYLVDGKLRIVKDKVARNENGNLAGSCYTMTDSARKMLSCGFTLCDIVAMCAENPAKAIGMSEIGSLEVGKSADIIVCDKELNVGSVYVRGERFI